MSRVGAIYKPRRARNTCVCQWCRKPFQATRYDAKTCSSRCRKALSRFTSDHDGSVTAVTRSGQITLNMGKKKEVVTVQREQFLVDGE